LGCLGDEDVYSFVLSLLCPKSSTFFSSGNEDVEDEAVDAKPVSHGRRRDREDPAAAGDRSCGVLPAMSAKIISLAT
jgi:hypothetical protein